MKDGYHNIFSEQSYFLSKERNEDYNPADPNYTKSISYSSELNEQKYGNLAPNFGFEIDNTAKYGAPLFWNISAEYDSPDSCYAIVGGGINNSSCLKLDNNTSPYKIKLYNDDSQSFTIDFDQYIQWEAHAAPDSPPDTDFKIDKENGENIVHVTRTRNGEEWLEAGNYIAKTSSMDSAIVTYYKQYDTNTKVESDKIPVKEQTTYTLSSFIKTQGNGCAYLGIKWFDYDNNLLNEEFIAAGFNTADGEWFEYSDTLSSPENAAWAKVVAANLDNKDDVWLDEIQFVEGVKKISIQKQVVTNYIDNLGRNFQTQFLKYSPADEENKLIVTGAEYDQLGRKHKTYLPLELSYNELQNQGLNYNSFISDYKAQADEEYGSEDAGTPWFQTVFTNDPTSRVITNYGPGGFYNETGERRVTNSYSLNSDNEAHGYNGNMLYKTMVSDNTYGDDIITNHIFRNAFGNIVETVQDAGGLDLHTINKYDVQNRLTKTYQPEGQKIYEEEKDDEYKEIIVIIKDIKIKDPGYQIEAKNIPVNDSTKIADIKLSYTANTCTETSVEYTLEYFEDSWHSLGSFVLADSGIQGNVLLQHEIPQEAVKMRLTIDSIEPANKVERAQTYSEYTIQAAIGFQKKAVLDDFESKYTYNTLDRLTTEEHPDKGLTEYVYAEDGKLRFKRDARHKYPFGEVHT